MKIKVLNWGHGCGRVVLIVVVDNCENMRLYGHNCGRDVVY